MGCRYGPKQSGLALLLVLILVASATVLGISYATSTTIKLISTDNLLRANRARYLAESGVEHCLYLVRTDPAALTGSETVLLGPFQADATSDRYYFGSAPVAGQTGQYVLTGRAGTGGVTQTVTLRVYLESRYKALMDSLGPMVYFRLSDPITDDKAIDSAGDWEGKYKDGTSMGWAGAIPGDANASAHFDGFNDQIELKNGAGKDPDLQGTKVTMMAWVWPDTHNHLANHNARIVSKAKETTTAETFWMIATTKEGSQTRLQFRLKTHADREEAEEEKEGTTHRLVSGTGDVPLGKWTFVAAVYTGTHMLLYQDGRLVGRRAKTGWITQDDGPKAWIGGSPSGDKDRPWHGRIDEVAIFDRDVTAAEILTLYEARLPHVDKLAWNE